MASLRCHRVRGVALMYLFVVVAFQPAYTNASQRGFVETTNASNTALIVGVSHGLSGIDIDSRNVEAMTKNPAYQFKNTTIADDKANVADISKELTQGAQDAKDDGTFLFYFSGHGNVGLIWPQDDTMTVEQIRGAIQQGRKGAGPLKRLVLIYDSCHAGSMMDPMRRLLPMSQLEDDSLQSAAFADAVIGEMTKPTRDGAKYWEKLMVIASSRSDETSLASADGSIFTLAMNKAYKESIAANNTVGEFIEKSQKYTEGHHPVARLVPASLKNEKMMP